MGAAVDPYRQAFDCLLTTASPELAAKALRAGLKVLLTDEESRPARPARIAAPAARKSVRRRRRLNGYKPRSRPATDSTPPAAETAGVLTPAERQRLDFLRQSAGVGCGLRPALLDAAINGAVLEPAVAKRVREFLAG